MGTVISCISKKGGVGKTTTLVGLALVLSEAFNKKVLVIDLDPQTNATIMLIGEKNWAEVNEAGNTVTKIFEKTIRNEKVGSEDVKSLVLQNVSDVKKVNKIDLISSSTDLEGIETKLHLFNSKEIYNGLPINILQDTLSEVISNYDYVLIDCPPSVNGITLNGLYISDYYLVPTIPDRLSPMGIPQIINEMHNFSKKMNKELNPLGVVVTKYSKISNVHKHTIKELENNNFNTYLFTNHFPQSNTIAQVAEYLNYKTVKQKLGDKYQFFHNFTEEVIRKVGNDYVN